MSLSKRSFAKFSSNLSSIPLFVTKTKKLLTYKGDEYLFVIGIALTDTQDVESGQLIKASLWKQNYFDQFKQNSIQVVDLKPGMYNGRVSYTITKVKESITDTLNRDVYDQYIRGTLVSQIPARDNMRVSDFDPGTELKFMSRTFIVPLSWENLMLDKSTLTCQVDRHSEFTSTGLSENTPTHQSSHFTTYLTQADRDLKVVFYCYADKWEHSFGIRDVDVWKKVGKRLMRNAQDWFVCASQNMEQLQKCPIDNDKLHTGGFVTGMQVNLPKTLQLASEIYSKEYVKRRLLYSSTCQTMNFFDDDHAHDETIEKAKNKESFCINLNELGPAVLETFFEHAPESTIFYGVRGEDYYDKLEVVVFAVNE